MNNQNKFNNSINNNILPRKKPIKIKFNYK